MPRKSKRGRVPTIEFSSKKSKRVQSDIHMRDRAATRQYTKHSEEAHQTSSPLMAASSDLKGKYDVFLSFRGPDVRNSFLSHFYTALAQKGIYSYVDGEQLRKGDCIKPALMKAIEESCIAIIIFSEDYASSPWCLEEVEKIMECKEQRGLTVFPVFYKVDPREVRTPRGSYREAMVKHENKFGRDSEKVKRWEKALFDAGNLFGWDLKDKDEADLINRIVWEISKLLDRKPLHVAKHPVGIHRQVVKLEAMLNLESHDDVVMIGLWGQGGIGKTTLAKALYNDIFRGFEASCFLANVRETSKDSKDFVHLQEKLLSEILVGKELTVFSVDGGINLMRRRLCHKKVLLILDDVDNVKQLNALAGGREWFGKGSRIIITTRDKHLLTFHRIDEDHIFEVKTLDDLEALELFNKHVFFGSEEIVMRRDLVDSALQYANGLPLALEVLGSFLCGRTEQQWESALSKLAKNPDKDINDVLKLSFDGLEDYAKEIFLDIACFFKGRSMEYIIKVLDSCDFDTMIGVEVLVEKSLITKDGATIQMHDLIQLMGMDIVKQECRDDPRGRSRLWLCEDVCDVLSGDMGTDAVQAIVLDLPKTEAIYIGPNAFTNMRRLRLLIMINVHNSFQGPICLPNGLRCFQWPECPSVLKFPPGPKKLVRLDLCKSNIQVAVDQFKDFKNLKFLCFRECLSMVCMPNLDLTPNLEELDLYGCKNLENAHQSVAYHAKLRWLNLKGCSNLYHLPDVLQTKNLQHLNLTGCSKLERFPDIPNKMKRLQELYLEGTSIEELPASIENLVSLVNLSLVNCKKMANLPSSIYKLPELVYLLLDGCSKLIRFPKEEDSSDLPSKTAFPNLQILRLGGCNLLEVEFLEKYSCFPNLRSLDLSKNDFAELPTCRHLHDIRELDVSECQQLQKIGSISMKLRDLATTNCESLSKIPSDILSIGRLSGLCLDCKDFKNLTFLCFRECLSMVCMPNLDLTPNLKDLNLYGCKNLEHAHQSVAYHAKLRWLNLKGCSNLHNLPDVLQTKNLQLLDLTGCSKLERFPDIPNKMKRLQGLYLKGTSIEELPASIENLVSLENLSLINCKKLSNLPSSIYKLPELVRLRLDGCSKLIRFPKKEEDSSDLPSKTGFPELRLLRLGGCNLLEVEFLKNYSSFPKLYSLDLSKNNFAELPSCRHLHCLRELDVSECRRQQKIGSRSMKLQDLEAMNCESLSKISSDILSIGRLSDLCLNNRELEKFILPGGEMPQWLLPNKEGYISFTVSEDFYWKIKELAICVVYQVKKWKRKYLKRSLYIDGTFRERIELPGSSRPRQLHSDHLYFTLKRIYNLCWGVAFGPNDSRSYQLGIKASAGVIVKKCGFGLFWSNRGDLIRDDKLPDQGLFHEVGSSYHETTEEEEISASLSDMENQRRVDHEDNCQTSSEEDDEDNYQTSSEEDDDIRPKKKQRKDDDMDNSPRADIMADFSVERSPYQKDNESSEEDRTSETEEDDDSKDDFLPSDFMFKYFVEEEDNQPTSSEEDGTSGTETDDDHLDNKFRTTDVPLRDVSMPGSDLSVEKWRYHEISPLYMDILPGGDMPEEFIIVEGSTISFMVSQDFYDKFLGLALCVVFTVEDGKKEIFFDIVPHLNGQRRNGLSGSLGSFNSNHMWIQYLKPNVLWGVLEGDVDFLEFDEDCLQFSLTLSVSGGTVKKLGYVLRCKQMDDDLKVVLEDKQLVNPASIYEMKLTEFFHQFLPRRMEAVRIRAMEKEARRMRRKARRMEAKREARRVQMAPFAVRGSGNSAGVQI